MTTLHWPADRVLLRRARRLAWRSPWRTLWTGLLVATAVAVGISAMAVTWGHHARIGSTVRAFGAADALYTAVGVPAAGIEGVTAAVRAAAPGTAMAVEQETAPMLSIESKPDTAAGGATTRSDVVQGAARMADWSDPLLDGVIDLVDGRRPGDGEVVVTPLLSQQTGLATGDRLELSGSDGSFEVVGIGTIGRWDDLAFAASTGALEPVAGATAAGDVRYYVGRPSGATGPLAMVESSPAAPAVEGPIYRDAAAAGVDSAAAPTPGIQIGLGATTVPAGSLVGLLAGVVAAVGLLAGAAFGIGAARRMRATGLLSANGADGAQLAMAAAAEALVVAAPAAAVGVAAAWAGRPLWIGLRLPGWTSLPDASLPWAVVVVTVIAAIVAAALGAVVFSRPVRRLSSSALLDGRTGGPATADTASGRRRGSDRIAVFGWLGLAMLAWLALYAMVGVAGVLVSSRTSVGVAASAAVVVLWLACAFGALRIVRLFLGRDPVGRLVDRDLRRRRIGSTATVLVVATWVFVAVGATATDWFRTGAVTSEGWADEVGSSGSSADPGSSATTVADGQPSTTEPAGATGTPPDLPASPTDVPRPVTSGSVLFTSNGGSSSEAGVPGASDWVVAGSEPVAPTAGPEPTSGLVAEIAVELAEVGLATQPAVLGRWAGECTVCPAGFVPTVLVLQSAQGVGLPQATVDLLESGAAVTSFDIEGVESQAVAGVPVRVADVPIGVSAIVLASAVRDGEHLTDSRDVLVGDSSGLDASQARAVRRVALDHDLTIESRSPMLSASPVTAGTTAAAPSDWVVWPWLVVLVLVTLVATAAHRREHTEAARVLSVLGAGPRAGRRLSSLTAGSLAGVGVGLGLTAALAVLAIAAARHAASVVGSPDGPFEGLWSRQATWVLLVALAVPFVVALLARLIPPSRSVLGSDGPMPA